VHTCTFTANSGSDGGALYSAAGSVNITDSYFFSNAALSAGSSGSPGFWGGAVYLSNAAAVITGSTFSKNLASSTGGAVHCMGGSVSFEGCEFLHNAAGAYGGAVYSVQTAVSMQSCALLSNTAAEFGGALYLQRATVELDYSTYIDNTAGEQGGTIYQTGEIDMQDSFCNMTSSRFFNNSASRGGAIHQDRGTLVLSHTVFSSNTALRSAGGAIWSSELSSLTVTAAEFSTNAAAVDGGALSIEGNSSITDTQFRNNSATKYGGAVIVKSTGAITFSTCAFSGNSAVDGGSVHAATVPDDTEVQPLTVTGCTFR
jgi:predicted outer membrane repeat protein